MLLWSILVFILLLALFVVFHAWGGYRAFQDAQSRWSGPCLSAIFVIVGGLGLYGVKGNPSFRETSFSDRDLQVRDLLSVVARVETYLEIKQDDGRGWEVLAPVYMSLGKYAQAAHAFAQALHFLGPSAARFLGLGQAVTLAHKGRITSEAKAAFLEARALDPNLPLVRFYIALSLEQEGAFEEALKVWKSLVQDESHAGADWMPLAREHITALSAKEAGQEKRSVR